MTEQMSTLQMYAAAALAGIVANPRWARFVAANPREMTHLAWEYAEAMLAEQKRRAPKARGTGE